MKDILDILEEKWKPIIHKGIDYTGMYEVSNLGRVRNITKNKQVNLMDLNDRYHAVYLIKEGVTVSSTVHVLVYEAFNSKKKDGFCVIHKDGDDKNNNLNNLVQKNRRDVNSSKNGLPVGVRKPNKAGMFSSVIWVKSLGSINLGTYTSPKKAGKAYKLARAIIYRRKKPTKAMIRTAINSYRESMGLVPLRSVKDYGAKQDFKPKHITIESLNY